MDNTQDNPGLEGVIAAQTRLSEVNGAEGRLILAGSPVEHLSGQRTFEEVLALLWDGALPPPDDEERLPRALAEARAAAFDQLDRLGDALDAGDAMEALRAGLAHLRSRGDDREDALALVGAAAVFAAAWSRRRYGLAPISPSLDRRHAADFLAMVGAGSAVADPGLDERAAALDAYLAAVVDHGLNASTFTARVVASTGSDLVSAAVAAVGALKGPLHGGAPGPVLDMLDAVGSPERARLWLEEELAAGRRIMGMGHRVYRVRDPRAAVLERALTRLAGEGSPHDDGGQAARVALARAVEREAERLLAERYPARALKANVEFFTAVLLEAIGLPRELFSATFALSRAAGWSAHVFEQREVGRLIRPASRYVGPRPAA